MITPSELTLAAAKTSSLQNISGVCVDKPAFLQQLNEAVQRLMTYGAFWNTVVKGRVCVSNNCIAWPRWVGTILSTNIGGSNRPIMNGWYEFMPLTSGDCLGYGGGRGWSSNVTVVDDGITPVYSNVPCGTPLYIRVYTRLNTDIGKTLTIYGINEFGQPLMSRDQLGNWYEGENVTTVQGFIQTSQRFREVTRITKPLTVGMLDVYGYDSTADVLYDMAHYEPSETEPRYRHTSIRGGCGAGVCRSNDGSKALNITFRAKLKFIPVVLDSDIVQIDNIAALKFMIQSLRMSENGDIDSSAKLETQAIHELNRQLAEKMPLNQIPVYVAPFGTALPSHAGIGQII